MSLPEPVDVVIVTYNNADEIRACIEPLAALADVRTIVVDNASSDETRRIVSDLRVETIALERNMGFAAGVNFGWRATSAPYVLLLNPDARIEPDALAHLVRTLDARDNAGAVGPRILEADGRVAFSQRRFPRPRSTYARAVFLHRVFPRSSWSDELVRNDVEYRAAPGARMALGRVSARRRSDLERWADWMRRSSCTARTRICANGYGTRVAVCCSTRAPSYTMPEAGRHRVGRC